MTKTSTWRERRLCDTVWCHGNHKTKATDSIDSCFVNLQTQHLSYRGDYLISWDVMVPSPSLLLRMDASCFSAACFFFFHSDEASRSPCAIAMAMAFVSSATRGAVAAPRPARLPAPVAEWHVHGGSCWAAGRREVPDSG